MALCIRISAPTISSSEMRPGLLPSSPVASRTSASTCSIEQPPERISGALSFWVGDAKTRGWPFLRDQLGGCLRRPKRHPAWRRREAQPGFCTERENLCSDAKGEVTSGKNREDQSTY